MTKTVKIVEPALCVAMYEVEKLIKEGYSISQTHEPIFIAGLYDIEMVASDEAPANVPNAKTVAAIKELEQGEGQKFESVEALILDLETDDKIVASDIKPAPARRGPKPKASK